MLRCRRLRDGQGCDNSSGARRGHPRAHGRGRTHPNAFVLLLRLPPASPLGRGAGLAHVSATELAAAAGRRGCDDTTLSARPGGRRRRRCSRGRRPPLTRRCRAGLGR